MQRETAGAVGGVGQRVKRGVRLRLTRKPGLREALTCACSVWTMRLRLKSGRSELAFGAVNLTVEIGKVAVGHEALGYCVDATVWFVSWAAGLGLGSTAPAWACNVKRLVQLVEWAKE
ncbi:hypothetical protein F0562_024077 [Nyssa sinensis]|uniref:Uncharacterized protein n=1 Tax=Nyssa sinensis TaxID=561372 RepID=A0A5J5BIE2_9ASTE|nr:hypothetical protein F0562_024077 [Nyssa sinensis]